MEIIKYIDIDRKTWDHYIGEIQSSTFNHTSHRIEFDMDLSSNIIQNESFIMKNQKEIIGSMSLYIEKNENGKLQFSLCNSYLFAPALNTKYDYVKQEKHLKEMMKYIDELGDKYNCILSMIRLDPLSNGSSNNRIFNYNYLMKYGYEDTSKLSQIVDLKLAKEDLWKSIRKGHKYEINKCNKFYEYELYDSENITDEKFQIYKDIYLADAGRVTKSLELSNHYLNWIKSQNCILALSKFEDKYVSAMLVYIYKNQSYYLSAAQDHSKCTNNLSSHGLQWFVMNYLKEINIEYYELGWQYYPSRQEEISKKEQNISLYKRGFGGFTVPLFSGIKRY